MKLTILSEDKNFLEKWKFFDFLDHEKIEYEIDALDENTDFILAFYYVIDGLPCDVLHVLQECKSQKLIDSIPEGAIFCFHGLDRLDEYSENQKSVCMELIDKLRELGTIYCTHIFDLMKILRMQKIILIAKEKSRLKDQSLFDESQGVTKK